MSSRSNPRNNVIAGVFLICGVALAVAASFVLSGVTFKPKESYIVRFDLREGATGIDTDAEVRLGGQPVGKVARTPRVHNETETGEYVIDVTIRIRRDIELREDARIYLEVPLLGAVSAINIVSVGTPAGEPAHDRLLHGRIAPPAILSHAGYGDEQRTQLQNILDRLDKGTEKLTGILDGLDPDLAASINQTVTDVREITAGVRERWPEWSGSITETIARSQEFTGKLSDLADRAGGMMEKGEGFIDSVSSLVDDNRERVDRIVMNVESITAGVNDEWIPRGNNLLSRAAEGLDTFIDVGEQAGAFMRTQRPTLDGILADSRLAADQLKLASVEIRSQPWRLLHRPSTKELETQLLYDSARSYAAAVSDLRAASQALDALLTAAHSRPELSAAEADALAGWRDELVRAFARYSEAEQRLFERMMKSAP